MLAVATWTKALELRAESEGTTTGEVANTLSSNESHFQTVVGAATPVVGKDWVVFFEKKFSGFGGFQALLLW